MREERVDTDAPRTCTAPALWFQEAQQEEKGVVCSNVGVHTPTHACTPPKMQNSQTVSMANIHDVWGQAHFSLFDLFLLKQT